MSTQQIPYEDALKKIASLETKIIEFTATKKGEEDKTKEHDKEMEGNFKKAQNDMDKEDKEHNATHDDMEKVKDAFKKAEDETDPEKKKEAMKRAMEMKDDHDQKHGKHAQEEHPKEDIDKQPQKEANVTEIVWKKIPLMNKILEADRLINPSIVEKHEKQLMAATLAEVQDEYEKLAPYIAVVGVGKSTPTPKGMGMIPYQAGAVTQIDATNIFEGDVDSIDFSKVSTKQILEMYQ